MRISIRIMAALIIISLLSALPALAGFSARYDILPITGKEFASRYNENARNLKAIEWKGEYDEESLASCSFEAGESVWLALLMGDDGKTIEEVQVEKGTATPTNFEYFLAVTLNALSVITPECSDEERLVAVASLMANGITEDTFKSQGHSTCQLGPSGEYAIVYSVSEKQRTFYMFKGTVR